MEGDVKVQVYKDVIVFSHTLESKKGVPECRVQTWRGGREHREEPKLHRKAWAESDRWRCMQAHKGKVSNEAATESSNVCSGASKPGRTWSFRATIEGSGRRRIARTPIFEGGVLHAVDQTPGTSVRALAASTGRSPTTIHRVLQGAALHPFHVQRVQSLQPDDPPRRVTFAQWFLNQIAADMHFASSVLFCDEATFSREGVFNTHMWALNNPHSTRPRAMQHRFTVNMWAGIVGDSLLGPYILPPRLDSHKYLVFLQEVLPELLTDVPAPIRRRMWFQQDGAPSYYARHVREHLDRTFPNRWIGHGGPVAWPPRSPDLSPLDFFLWGAMQASCMTRPSFPKWTWSHGYPSLLLGSVKYPVFSKMFGNPCRVGAVCAYMPMVAISNTSSDAFTSYFLFIIGFLFKKAFSSTFCVVALLSLCLFISLGLRFRPCFPM
ncbi:uncharacterized protein TNCV_4104141 [Trichonephila clavipes]|nr:uncharacterized protein TNCV_4104141 [Trichonephila clavipes]